MVDFSFNRNIQQESGGQQFDRNGNPLTSSAGAIGIAQIMPSTGPEAAQDAGLPWDPNRFRTDANYNRQLGEAYHQKLIRKYGGDVVLADAAYNGGPSRLDANIAKYGRAGALSHMPLETRNYVSLVRGVRVPGPNGSGVNGGSAVGVPDIPPGYLATPQVTPDANSLLDGVMNAATGAAPTPNSPTGGNRFPVVDPFTVGTDLNQAASGVNTALTKQDQFLDSMSSALGTIQTARVARVQEQVDQKRQINQTIGNETQSMIDRVTPMMQRRAAIADQLNKVANMNPLARGILSIFDPNYDTKHLTDKLNETGQALESVTHDYEYMTNLRQRLATLVDQKAAGGEALEHVQLQDLDENQHLYASALSAANQKFGFIGDEVGQNENLVRAQMQSSDRLLTQMAPADIATAMENARKSPNGSTVVDGVPLSFGELRARSLALTDQTMAARSQQIALERGENDLADYHAGKWAETATETQIQSAIQANGNYNGMRIPMSMLTQQLALRHQATALQVQDIQTGGQVAGLGHDVASFQNDYHTIAARTASMFGGSMPPQLRDAFRQATQEMGEMNQQFSQAKAKGPDVLNDTALQMRQRMQTIRENFLKQVDAVALEHAGGDKNAAGWISTFMRGGRLDANQSAEAMYYYAQKGGLPTGMRASPQARAAFQAAQQAMTDTDADIANRMAAGQHFTQPQRKQMILQRIQQTASRAYTTGAMNDIIDALPTVAQRAGDAFGQVSPQDWQAAQRQGQMGAYDNLGRSLGVSRTDAQALIAGSYNKPDKQKLLDQINNQQLRGQLIAQTHALTLQALDRSPSAKGNFKPSEALYHFLSRPDATRLAQQYQNMSGSASFGDFLGVGTGANVSEQVGRWSQAMQGQVVDNRVAAYNRDQRDYSMYNVDPYHRAFVVLSGMKGFSEPEANQLISALQQTTEDPENPRQMTGGNSNNATDGVFMALRGVKFQTPALERLRKLAVQQWEETARITDSAMDRNYRSQ